MRGGDGHEEGGCGAGAVGVGALPVVPELGDSACSRPPARRSGRSRSPRRRGARSRSSPRGSRFRAARGRPARGRRARRRSGRGDRLAPSSSARSCATPSSAHRADSTPGPAAERRRLDPGVLAENPRARLPHLAPEPCLPPCVLVVRRPVLVRKGARSKQLDLPAGQRGLQLVELVCVARRELRPQGRHCTRSTPSSLASSSATRADSDRREARRTTSIVRSSPNSTAFTVPPSSSIRASTLRPVALGFERDRELRLLGPHPGDEACADELERAERDEHEHRGADRNHVVAGAGCHPDRGDDPQCRRRRQAANVDPTHDDRPCAEEADPRHDLRCDPRRVEDESLRPRERPVRPAVGRDEREGTGPERHEQVRPEARLVVAHFPLEPDRAAKPGGEQQSQQRLGGREVRHARLPQHRPGQP